MTLTRRDLLAGAAAGAGLTGTPDWLHAAPARPDGAGGSSAPTVSPVTIATAPTAAICNK